MSNGNPLGSLLAAALLSNMLGGGAKAESIGKVSGFKVYKIGDGEDLSDVLSKVFGEEPEDEGKGKPGDEEMLRVTTAVKEFSKLLDEKFPFAEGNDTPADSAAFSYRVSVLINLLSDVIGREAVIYTPRILQNSRELMEPLHTVAALNFKAEMRMGSELFKEGLIKKDTTRGELRRLLDQRHAEEDAKKAEEKARYSSADETRVRTGCSGAKDATGEPCDDEPLNPADPATVQDKNPVVPD